MNYFVLENPTLADSGSAKFVTDFLEADPFVLGESARCPACGGLLHNRMWMPPHRVELTAWGPRFGDVAFGSVDDFLVSARFVDAWAASGLVGLTGFDPVEIVKVSQRTKGGDVLPPAYWRVNTPFSRAAIDEQASGIRWEGGGSICSECRFRGYGSTIKRLDRVVLETAPRPAEDIFFARGLWGVRIASERFATFCAEHEFLNVKLTSAENFSFRYDHLYPKT